MATFLLKLNGARFSEDAKNARINAGLATEADFTPEGAALDAAGDVVAAPPATGVFLLKSSGARFSTEAKAARVGAGLATEEDFIPEGTEVVAPAAAPAQDAPAPVAAAPAPGAVFWKLPSGLVLTPEAAVGYVQRGLCTPADLVPLDADQNPLGTVVAAAPELPVLPLNADSFNKNDIVAIAEALGLDTDGSKAAIVARVNALGDEAGTKAAIEAIGG